MISSRAFRSVFAALALQALLSGAWAQTIDAGLAPESDAVYSHFDGPRADRIVVRKSERKLFVLKAGEVLREMDISLGLMPTGHKERSGDYRTPEGLYYLSGRNQNSDYFLSIQVSYPNERDRIKAERLGVDPGGQIMIHGLPNVPRLDERSYAGTDWTDGCIAVSNSDMVDLWLMTPENTPIEILP